MSDPTETRFYLVTQFAISTALAAEERSRKLVETTKKRAARPFTSRGGVAL